jgi:hypothetical protein
MAKLLGNLEIDVESFDGIYFTIIAAPALAW